MLGKKSYNLVPKLWRATRKVCDGRVAARRAATLEAALAAAASSAGTHTNAELNAEEQDVLEEAYVSEDELAGVVDTLVPPPPAAPGLAGNTHAGTSAPNVSRQGRKRQRVVRP